MSSLAQQQQSLLAALFEWPAQNAMKNIAACAEDTGARGIKAYQTNGHVLAERALQAAYPVIRQLLGDESFADLARALWHAYPPQHGDVGRWGENLATFIGASEQLAAEPYLADVARAEWCMHQISTAASVLSNPASLTLLTTEDPTSVTLAIAPGSRVLRSAWPVASILNAHLAGEPAFDVVAVQLRNQLPQDLVVWRSGFRPQVREALAGEYEVIDALSQGTPLAQALEHAPALDFSVWFPMALRSGLVTGVIPVYPPSPLP